jgi:hypothetical protein
VLIHNLAYFVIQSSDAKFWALAGLWSGTDLACFSAGRVERNVDQPGPSGMRDCELYARRTRAEIILYVIHSIIEF